MGTFIESKYLVFRSLRRFVSLSLILATVMIVVRLYEIVVISNFSNYPAGSTVDLLIGLKYDLVLFLRVSSVLMIPFLLIAFFSQKAAKYFFVTLSLLLILGDILLVKYFSIARVPLGADLLGYSVNEMKETIGASGEMKILPLLFIVAFLVYVIRVFVVHVYFKLNYWIVSGIALVMLLAWLPIRQLNINPSSFSNEFSMFVTWNKLDFFAQSMITHYKGIDRLSAKPIKFKEVESVHPDGNPFKFVDQNYPFLHEETTPDVLGEYFNQGNSAPNFVFIVVESLGRAYSGKEAYLGNFTPFLDSLMQKSLYWENCLSTSGRTFQVLPSVLASVPFGEKGFAELGEKMPDHLSLISLLKKQSGYSSTFFYGGDAKFDNMELFLRKQGTETIIDAPEFGAGYEKLPADGNGFSWGYGDKEIFRRYLQDIHENPTKRRIDVMLTLAMHDPFHVHNQESYERKFEERLSSLDLSAKTKDFDRQYARQFATILYFDDALRYFITEFSKLESFANTIFIITGDHRMPEIPISTQIDRFHVPLVIYSPLLKKAQKFSSVVTHFDVTPSILALLNARKYVRWPTVASWIGHGFDTSVDFRNLNSYPLMRNKNELLDYIDQDRFLSNKTVYKVNPDLDIEPMQDVEIQRQMREKFDDFILRNDYAWRNNKLIPDSLRSYR